MPRSLLAVACAVVLIAACGEPASRERFIRSDGSGEYAFQVEMTDTSASYDLSFYTAIDRPLMQPDTLGSFPMRLLWRSPSGRFYSETVYYPADSSIVHYRTGLIPSENGSWELQISISPEPAGLRGMGLVVARNTND